MIKSGMIVGRKNAVGYFIGGEIIQIMRHYRTGTGLIILLLHINNILELQYGNIIRDKQSAVRSYTHFHSIRCRN